MWYAHLAPDYIRQQI